MARIAKVVALGIGVGLFMGFVDSYGYAVSGFTTSEISVVFIPIMVYAAAKVFGARLSMEELVVSSSIAIGIDITTTLTSGMYVTYGFLSYVATRLAVFGIRIGVPHQLFSLPHPLALEPMPIYVSLSIASASGALIAFALRHHYIEKERLLYPFGTAAAMLVRIAKSIRLEHLAAVLVGFAAQLIYMLLPSSMVDLTPLLGSAVPGAVLAISFNPLIIALLLLIPLGSLRSISMGSLATYLALLPIAVALCGAPYMPSPSYEDSLLAYSNLVSSCLAGAVAIVSAFYLVKYRTAIFRSLSMLRYMGAESWGMAAGAALLASIIMPLALIVKPSLIPRVAPVAIAALATHFILILVNRRVVGETGRGSKAVLPLVTLELFAYGCRGPGVYAVLDPYTGIPMPQVVAGTAMNVVKMTMSCGARSSRSIAGLCLGIALGSFATYIFGNLLVYAYGINSPKMPLYRWLPTVVWMATIYSRAPRAIDFRALLLGVALATLVVILSARLGVSAFPFVVGITLPPDIGLLAFAAYLTKVAISKLGVEAQEKLLASASLSLVGCGAALALYTALVALT